MIAVGKVVLFQTWRSKVSLGNRNWNGSERQGRGCHLDAEFPGSRKGQHKGPEAEARLASCWALNSAQAGGVRLRFLPGEVRDQLGPQHVGTLSAPTHQL